MKGKCQPVNRKPITRSPIVVRMELTTAIIPCALKTLQNPATIFELKYRNS